MFYCKKKHLANLKAFREQAVDDGYIPSIGTLKTHEGFEVLAVEGTLWEYYDEGNTGKTFKQVGSNMSFTVYCENLPYADYHN